MTREEAIKALSDRDNFLWWEMSKEEREYYSEVFDMAISALENNREWIPVTERLPKPEDKQEIGVIVSYENEDGEFVTKGTFNNKYGFNYPSVKAWQPLPETYKEGGK